MAAKSATGPGDNDDDDFGLSSGDEAACLALTESVDGSHKRKASEIPETVQPITKQARREGLEASRHITAARQCLKDVFGFADFRLEQARAIDRLLSGQSAVVIFPTGGGKSLCYQIPALCFDGGGATHGGANARPSGLTIVVSPLIALMKDQVDFLRARRVPAHMLNSALSAEQAREVHLALREDRVRLLYVSPEKLHNEGFLALIAQVPGGVRMVAVDEAHCVSEWGHSFRPDYLKIARFVKEIKAERTVCLTATAPPKVANDIRAAFDIEEAGLFRTTTYRPNLHLLATAGETRAELRKDLVSFLRSHPGSAIVYVTLQRQAHEEASFLQKAGFHTRAFHANVSTEDKTLIQDEFKKRNDLIIVATIAFGMGIDKSNIRTVVHLNLPSSLESYSQEIGRAGRDGKPSFCKLYICAEEMHLRERFSRGDLPPRGSIRALLDDVFESTGRGMSEGDQIRCKQFSQQQSFDLRPDVLRSIFVQLELNYGLLRESTPEYSMYQYEEGPNYGELAMDRSKLVSLLRKHASKGRTIYKVDVDAAASEGGISRGQIIHKLNELELARIIKQRAPTDPWTVYTLCRALPTATELDRIATELESLFLHREEQSLARSDQVLHLIRQPACIAAALAAHFGDTLPSSRCGHCTFCIDGAAVVVPLPPSRPFDTAAFHRLLDRVPDRDDPRFLARVAWGLSSPRMTQREGGAKGRSLKQDPVFESMADHPFEDLLAACIRACELKK